MSTLTIFVSWTIASRPPTAARVARAIGPDSGPTRVQGRDLVSWRAQSYSRWWRALGGPPDGQISRVKSSELASADPRLARIASTCRRATDDTQTHDRAGRMPRRGRADPRGTPGRRRAQERTDLRRDLPRARELPGGDATRERPLHARVRRGSSVH